MVGPRVNTPVSGKSEGLRGELSYHRMRDRIDADAGTDSRLADADEPRAMNRVLEVSATAHDPFTPTRERPVRQLKERGVWIADILDSEGNPIIQAISRDGRLLSAIPWLPGLLLERLIEDLWRYLDLRDPAPPRLVR